MAWAAGGHWCVSFWDVQARFGYKPCRTAKAAVVYTKTLWETPNKAIHQSPPAAECILWPGLS
jgi:hypothetical protein